MRPLSVVILTPWGERLGGAEEMLWTALRTFDPERLRPTVIFLGDGPFATEVADLGIETEVFPCGRLRQPLHTARAIGRIRRVLRRRRPDVILNWSAKTQLYGSTAAIAAGLSSRVVWWQHQIPSGHWLDRLATVLPARAIGCSSSAGREAQLHIAPRRPAFVVNPGFDFDGNGGRARRHPPPLLRIPSGRYVMGIVGRLQPWKGQDRFLLALADLRQRGRDVHGLIVGGDAWGLSTEYAAGLESLIGQLGLSDAVTMTGQVDDPLPYYAAMDVAVNASDGEPFGIVLLEAMAAGIPVVAVGRGGPLDIVEPGVTGVLAASGDPLALADAIDPLLDDPGLRSEMGAAGQRRCRERFGAAAMTDGLSRELEWIVHG